MPKARSGGGYADELRQVRIDYMSAAIDKFAQKYRADWPTLILFPGGLGSKLRRDDNERGDTERDWYTSWVSGRTFWNGEPRNLRILPSGEDVGNRYIIPDGFVDFFSPFNAYDGFVEWCKSNKIQVLVYPFDWRRSSQEAADFFLDNFLPAVDAAIACHKGKGKVLVNYSLVGHSLGGMAVKLVLNADTDDHVKNMTWAITVATPFYGYGAQIHRYFYGFKALNWLLAQPDEQNEEMAGVIGSMPGGYEFIYMSHQTYCDNKRAFKDDDPRYPLRAYPSVDPSKQPVDPYFPPKPQSAYYPLFDRTNFKLLQKAVKVAGDVAEPLKPGVAEKFFNIRGIQTTKNGTRLKDTVVGQVWSPVFDGFDVNNSAIPDPIRDVKGFGDGTQPAWGARLLQMLKEPDRADNVPHVINVENNVKHMYMMEHPAVQAKIAMILRLPPAAQVSVDFVEPASATRQKFDEFLMKMPQPRGKVPESAVRCQIYSYLSGFTPKELERLALRAFEDMLVHTPLPRRPEASPERPKKRKPAKRQAPPKRRRR